MGSLQVFPSKNLTVAAWSMSCGHVEGPQRDRFGRFPVEDGKPSLWLWDFTAYRFQGLRILVAGAGACWATDVLIIRKFQSIYALEMVLHFRLDKSDRISQFFMGHLGGTLAFKKMSDSNLEKSPAQQKTKPGIFRYSIRFNCSTHCTGYVGFKV